ncbi:AP-3 complex subunit delta [Mortierella sp. GBA30]|nr:AP-3 complex subunit delta [Mortierella sp. GBA30]
MNQLFAHTLTDLIRGIRQNKKNEQAYIAKEIADIRLELRRNDPDLKAQAIAKLTYLQMMGYDMSWASFHVVEVMSSPKFLYKGIGYLGAVQSFNQDTDVLMLTTNLIKKDLASSNPSEIGVAINGLSHILTPDLARDLCADLVAMLNHSRPIVRKKVLLVLYKVFLKYPEGLRLSFARMKERLEDQDPSVVSAAVNVICELARRNPKSYLSLAPQLFNLLTTSSNNWMLIKIIKLFAALTPYEPRLTKKLLPHITTLIQTTKAMSLLYECIHTVIAGGMLATSGSGSNAESANTLAATCVTKLRTFLEDPDQNLKYISLLALTKILPTHPHLVGDHKDIILKCIDDPDISIRMRALDLIVGMANKKNLTEIVKRLISHLLPANESETANNSGAAITALMDPVYRADIIRRIVFICSQNSYANVTNFEWYLAVLSDLTNVAGVNVGDLLMQQFMDVGVRVKSARPYTVKLMMQLLADTKLTEPANPEDSNSMVLLAAAWLTGEYCSLLESPEDALGLLSQNSTAKLDPAIQATYLQSMLKIFAFWMNSLQYSWTEEARQSLVEMVDLLRDGVKELFGRSPDLEVQERASNVSVILDIIAENAPRTPLTIANSISFAPTMPKPPSILGSLYPLFFNQELNPVAPKAQKKVPVPEGLDLESWIHEPVPEPEPESSDDDFLNERGTGQGYSWNGNDSLSGKSKRKGKKGKSEEDSKESAEARAKRKAERRERQKHDPYYIGGDSSPKSQKKSQDDLDVDSIPLVQLSMDGFEKPIVLHKKDKSGSKKKSKRRERSRSPPVVPVEFAAEDMPEDAMLSASDDESNTMSNAYLGPNNRGILDQDTSALHHVDLSVPVGEDEHLPRTKPYMKPEEVRQYEDELAQRRRIEAAQSKKEKKESKKAKSSKKSASVAEGEGTSKKKSSKKSKTKEEPLIVLETPSPVPVRSPTPERPKSVEPVMDAPEKKKSKKISSKTETKAKKTTTAKKATKTPAIVAFPERSNIELVLNENVALTYDIALSPSSLETPTAPGQEPASDPMVLITFKVHNRNVTESVSSVRVALADSFDVRLGGSHTGEESVALSSSIEPQGNATLTMDLLVLGRVRYELRIMGTLFYELDGLEESLEFSIAVPPSTFMLAIPRLTGADFSKILTEQLESFSATGSTTVRLSSGTSGQDEQFWDAVEKITKEITHTHVVEVVDGAASFFGQSWQGYQVAGLIKVMKGRDGAEGATGEAEVEDGTGLSKTIEVEMKCTDQSFVDGLAQEILNVGQY